MSTRVQRGRHNRWCRTCGWKNTYDTAAKADWCKRRHSCARQLAIAEQQTRGVERRNRVDRTPQPCLHKLANHQHGHRATYVLDRCRCLPCAEANTITQQWRVRQKAYGRYDRYVDADRSRSHIRDLMGAGMGLKRIVAVSDLSQGFLWKLLYGKKRPNDMVVGWKLVGDGIEPVVSRTLTRRVLRTTETRVLAVTVDLADGAVVDSRDSARRIQALVACGWSMSKIATRLGIHPTNFTALAHGTSSTTVATARAVHNLYVDLVDQAPPEATHRDKIAATRARNYAQAHWWAPPLRIYGKPWIGQPHNKEAS